MEGDSHQSSAKFGGVSVADKTPVCLYHKDISHRLQPVVIQAGFGTVDWPI